MEDEKKAPKVKSEPAAEPTKTVELKVGEVIVCPKGTKENCFKTTKNDWDRVYSKGANEGKYELSEEKKS